MALAYNLPGALHTDSFTVGDYTYTGSSIYIDDGNGKWRIKFLSNGTFTPTKNVKVDIFAVGGGGGGSGGDSVFQSSLGSAGGGGGYTTTVKTQTLTAGTAYPIVVGSGGAGEPRQQKVAPAAPVPLVHYVLLTVEQEVGLRLLHLLTTKRGAAMAAQVAPHLLSLVWTSPPTSLPVVANGASH